MDGQRLLELFDIHNKMTGALHKRQRHRLVLIFNRLANTIEKCLKMHCGSFKA